MLVAGLGWCDHAAAAAPVALDDIVLDAAAASACPDDGAIRARLDRYLDGTAAPAVPVRASVSVATRSGGFELHLAVDVAGVLDERVLSGPTCPSLIDAALLIVALHVESASEPATVAEPPPARARHELASPASAWPPPSPHSSAAFDLGLVVRAEASLSLATVPNAAPGALLEFGARLGPVELALGALWASETGAWQGPGRGALVTTVEGTARVGYRIDLLPLVLAPSARVGVGALIAEGVGAERVYGGATLWVDLAAGLEARFVVVEDAGVQLAIAASAELVFAVTAPRVLLAGEAVFVPSDVGGRFGVGLVLTTVNRVMDASAPRTVSP